MSTATSHASAGTARGAFLRSRIGSLLAFAPLSVWTTMHLWHNLAAFQGATAWQEAVTEYPHPIAQLVTAIVVLLPLVLHTIWGFSRLLTARPNNVRYGFYANFKYALQRLSAVGVFFFIAAHLWLATLHPRLVEGHAEAFGDIAHEMHFHGPTLVVYVLGTLGVSYHLANGLQTFCMGWGVVTSRRALKKLDIVSIGFFVLLLGMSWGAIYALWKAGSVT
jgi:succinate dehydrogenase / fumarate reductase, cytochrome b subunit